MNDSESATFIWQGWAVIAAISTVVAAVATVLYTYFTYHLLSATKRSIDIANHNKDISNKLAEFQIYSKIADQLSSPKALDLLDAIEENWFDIDEIDETKPGAYSNPQKAIISGKELRRFVLGPIEDLAKFKSDGIITIESIDSGFGNTILMLGNSELVVRYVRHLRSKVYYSDNIHCGFESLYHEVLNLCSVEEKVKYKNYFDS